MSTEEQNLRDELVKQNPGMANYKIVFNQSPKSHALLLQFPNREAWKPYSNQTGQKPTELRIKPKCGYIEVDVPIPIGKQWNVDQAITFQDAISKSPTLQRGGSLGLPGGLSSSLKPIPSETATNPIYARPPREQLIANPDDTKNKEYMMSKITLQGQIHPRDDTQPRYLMGTFKGDTCYMSQVDAIVQLSPVPIHIDAINELARSTNRFQRNSERNDEEGEAKVVNLTIKSSEPEDVEGVGERSGIAKILKEIAEEPWQRLQWIDQDAPESYQRFEEHFGMDEDDNCLPDLVSTITDRQWLDLMSAPRFDHTKKKRRAMTHPRDEKRKRLADKQKKSKGIEIGKIDDDGWEYVDPNAPEEPGFEYEERPAHINGGESDSDSSTAEEHEITAESGAEG